MSYFLNTNNHIASEVNDRLSNMIQRILNELPEDVSFLSSNYYKSCQI